MSTKKGREGESIAKRYFRKKGHTILAENYRKREGEIDLVVRDGSDLVFVEVKTRRSRRFGPPEDAIDERKLKKMAQTAERFLMENPKWNGAVRFDCFLIQYRENGKATIRHIKNVRLPETSLFAF